MRDDVLAFADPQLAADVVQAAELDDPWDGAAGFLDPAVDDERVELVGQRAGLAVLAVVADLPLEGGFPEAVLPR